MDEEVKETQDKPKKFRKVLKIILITFLALVVTLVGAGYGLLKYYHSLLDYQPPGQEGFETEDWQEESSEWFEEETEATEEETVVPPEDEEVIESLEQEMEENVEEMEPVETLPELYHLLLVGVDSRNGDFSGRSDSMILLTINTKAKRIVATSILRDVFVTIPGRNTNRINAAYQHGGMTLLAETIKANFGIPVDRCVVVNFSLVREFVDYLGGVDIHVSNAEIRVMNNYIREQNKLLGLPEMQDTLPENGGGILHLNGQQAVGFARIRYVGNNDFGRTERQREILMQCFEKIKGMGLGQLNDLAHKFLPKIRTNLSEADCLQLLLMLPKALGYEIKMMALPVDGTWQFRTIRGMSVISVDFAANTAAWKNAVGIE